MSNNERTGVVNSLRRPSVALGAGATAALVGLTAVTAGAAGARPSLWKPVGIAWVAFAAMAGGAALGVRAAADERARELVWGYGLASGAMVTSAAVFLVPGAVGRASAVGGFGVAAGVLAGYGAHTVGHRLSHADALDGAAAELTAHALAAGTVIGAVYGTVPELGPLLGVAIVSHKAPAGYAAARRLARRGGGVAVLLVPAAGVGLAALPVAVLAPATTPTVNAAVFGFAAGVFLHVAMDFLPDCEAGGEVVRAAGLGAGNHELLDRLRLHAVAATAAGGVAVFLAWLATA